MHFCADIGYVDAIRIAKTMRYAIVGASCLIATDFAFLVPVLKLTLLLLYPLPSRLRSAETRNKEVAGSQPVEQEIQVSGIPGITWQFSEPVSGYTALLSCLFSIRQHVSSFCNTIFFSLWSYHPIEALIQLSTQNLCFVPRGSGILAAICWYIIGD